MENLIHEDAQRDPRNPPEGWSALAFSDIVHAYRKAKADAFFERTLPTSEMFARFECEDPGLPAKLHAFHERLNGGEEAVAAILEEGIGRAYLIPKKLKRDPKTKDEKGNPIKNGHSFLSDPIRALKRAEDTEKLTGSFRTAVDVSVEFRIVAALWVNWIGHRYDACLDASAYGSRLRRIRSEDIDHPGAYHMDAPGSFGPYFFPYKQWRDTAFLKIRNKLEVDDSVVVLTLDLKSFYHHVDPSWILNFPIEDSRLKTDWEHLSVNQLSVGFGLTRALVKAYEIMGDKARKAFGLTNLADGRPFPIGLPLGDSAARIMANVLLARWDKAIQECLTPVHYGRYVDDMMLVLRDNKKDQSTQDVMSRVVSSLRGMLDPVADEWEIKLGEHEGKTIQGASRLILQNGKHKVFFLSGQAGLDMLESVEKEITDVASERRLMPDVDFLDRSPAAKVLTAAGNPGLEPDTFGRAEGLTVRRLGWSIQMRNAETLAEDLPKDAWKQQREKFYEFSRNHVLAPLTIFDQFQSIPRLVRLAISTQDWRQAIQLMGCVEKSTQRILDAKDLKVEINGEPHIFPLTTVAGELRELRMRAMRECALAAWPHKGNGNPVRLTPTRSKEFSPYVGCDTLDDSWGNRIQWMAWADLAKVPYKVWHREFGARPQATGEPKLSMPIDVKGLPETWGISSWSALMEFMDLSKTMRGIKDGSLESHLPFLFPTRPYSAQEIVELIPACVGIESDEAAKTEDSMATWGRFVKAIRGTWVDPKVLSSEDTTLASASIEPPSEPKKREKRKYRLISLDQGEASEIKVALANLRTEDSAWAGAASGKPELTLERYRQLARLANGVLKLPREQRPDYLVLPELALPREWVSSFSNRLIAAEISLIAGVEYLRVPRAKVANEVCLILTDRRLGYASSLKIWHRKSRPAYKERDELRAIHGKTMVPGNDARRVYVHRGFAFGLLICSELQNLAHQAALGGAVDAVVVPSWNRDLKTFSSTIDAACFGMHAHVIYANNGLYGDARIRSPFSADYLQDVCRIRGGINPYVVVSKINIEDLRRFHSRSKTTGDGQFKPTPDGFKCASYRKTLPPE